MAAPNSQPHNGSRRKWPRAIARMGVAGFLVLTLGSTAFTVAQGQGQGQGSDNGGGHQPVNVCHATGSDNNPYVFITVDSNSTALEGHKKHAVDGNPPGGRHDIIDGFNGTVKSAGDCPQSATPVPPTVVPPTATQTGGHEPVNVCHATGSDNNPYVFITVDSNSTALEGHKKHAADGNPPGGRHDIIDGVNGTVRSATDCPQGPTATPVPPTPTNPPVGPTPTNTEVVPTPTNTEGPAPTPTTGIFNQIGPGGGGGGGGGGFFPTGPAAGGGALAPSVAGVTVEAPAGPPEPAVGSGVAGLEEEKAPIAGEPAGEVAGVNVSVLPVTGGPPSMPAPFAISAMLVALGAFLRNRFR